MRLAGGGGGSWVGWLRGAGHVLRAGCDGEALRGWVGGWPTGVAFRDPFHLLVPAPPPCFKPPALPLLSTSAL